MSEKADNSFEPSINHDTNPSVIDDGYIELCNQHRNRYSGLGGLAVNLSMNIAYKELNKSDDYSSTSYYTDRYRIWNTKKQLHKHISEARDLIVQDYDPACDKAIEFSKSNNSPWLDKVLSEYGSISSAILRISCSDKAKSIPDATLLNVLEWYNYNHAQANIALEETFNGVKNDYRELIKASISNGHLPLIPARLLNDGIDNAKMVVDDGYNKELSLAAFSYDLVLKSGVLELDKCVLFRDQKQITESSYHELNHVVSHVDIDRGSVIMRNGIRAIFGDGEGHTVVNEAVTEHIAISLEDQSYDVIKGKAGSYRSARLLLYVLCEKGDQKISIRKFIDAYFELIEPNSLRDSVAAKDLKSSLEQAWPDIDIINQIQNLKFDTLKDSYLVSLAELNKSIHISSKISSNLCSLV